MISTSIVRSSATAALLPLTREPLAHGSLATATACYFRLLPSFREPLPDVLGGVPAVSSVFRFLEKPAFRPLGAALCPLGEPAIYLLEEKASLSVLVACSSAPGRSSLEVAMLQGVRYSRDGEAEHTDGEGCQILHEDASCGRHRRDP